MSLTQALATAVTGLRATQTGLSIVAGNVANAETPGYVRKTPGQVSTATGAIGAGVHVAAINRQVDQYIQRQMRVESSGAPYAGLRAEFFDRLQSIYGFTIINGHRPVDTIFTELQKRIEAVLAGTAKS